ncbi:MAG: pyridoxamine 5'-phosphate oxidase family protein [Dehalococcoidia bacterium]|nr:pyridoxamine 5'-phosphate oxidase family protein [Dehalococcoidia bacterium]
MDVRSFDEIRDTFNARIARIVWATVTTVDAKGRPRARLLHPIWDGSTGWIATGRHSFKAKHIELNPYVSVSYWDQQHEQVFAECRAQWADDTETKRRVWELFKSTAPPLGYDPAMFWPKGPDDREFGALRLEPWRIELYSLADLAAGRSPTVWRAPRG